MEEKDVVFYSCVGLFIFIFISLLVDDEYPFLCRKLYNWISKTLKRAGNVVRKFFPRKVSFNYELSVEPVIDAKIVNEWLKIQDKFKLLRFNACTVYTNKGLREVADLFAYMLKRVQGQKCSENIHLTRVFSLYESLLQELECRDPGVLEENKVRIENTLSELSNMLIGMQKKQEMADSLQLGSTLNAIDRFVQLRR